MKNSALVLAALAMSLPASAGDPFTSTTPGKAGANGVVPSLLGKGLGSTGSVVDSLVIDGAASSSMAHLVVGATEIAAPFAGGVLGPSPDVIVFGLDVARSGELAIPFRVPDGVPVGTAAWIQAWIDDPEASASLSATNTLRFEVQGPATGPLFPNAQYPAGDVTQSIATGDLNGDGHPDIVTVSGQVFTPGVVVLLGRGDGAFEAAQFYGEGDNPQLAALGDVDGDGVLDVVASDALDGISVLTGAGDGTFSAAQSFAVGDAPGAPVLADFNGDGALDVVVVNGLSNDVSVLLGTGDGSFTPALSVPLGVGLGFVSVGDLDLDGSPDLVVTGADSQRVNVLLGIGDGTFISGAGVVTNRDSRATSLADFNGDGWLDLVVSSPSTDTVFLCEGAGDGSFSVVQTLEGINAPIAVASHDLNDDGLTDVAVTRAASDDVAIFFGTGDGRLRRGPEVPVGDSPREIGIADFDGDGAVDLAVANQNGDDVIVILRDEDGGFLSSQQYGVGGAPSAVATGDFDGDGTLDIAAASADSGVSLLRGVGGVSYRQAVTTPVAGARALAVGDLNGDGVLDIAAAFSALAVEGVVVLLGTGNGTFVEADELDLAFLSLPRSIVIGDVNGDGAPDLVTANSNLDNVSVFLGVGGGSFLPEQRFDVVNGPSELVLADLDDDGVLDLAVTNDAAPGGVSILLGQGDGTFASAITYATGGVSVSSLAVGNLDGDDVFDIVAVDRSQGSLVSLIGQGDGAFVALPAELQPTIALQGPLKVTLGDLDGDGTLDAVVAGDSVVDDVVVLHGVGDGTFGESEGFGVGEGPRAITLADVDGDGLLDVVVANGDSDDVTVLVNQLAK